MIFKEFNQELQKLVKVLKEFIDSLESLKFLKSFKYTSIHLVDCPHPYMPEEVLARSGFV